MSTPWIIILSILGAVIVIPPIVQLLVLISLKHQASSTEWYLMDRLRYIVYITGQVRAGKTTFAAGYTNIRTKALIRKVQNKVEFTCLAVPEAPFDEADWILEEDFRSGEADAWKEVRKLVSKGMPFEGYRNFFYDNHVSANPVPFVKMLEAYINAYPKANSLIAYAGLDPAVMQSGQMTGEHMHITKKGNSHLRATLYLAVTNMILSKAEIMITRYVLKKKNSGLSYDMYPSN